METLCINNFSNCWNIQFKSSDYNVIGNGGRECFKILEYGKSAAKTLSENMSKVQRLVGSDVGLKSVRNGKPQTDNAVGEDIV